MAEALRVKNAKMAKEIGIEAARGLWRYTIPNSFFEAEYDADDKSWKVEADYFEVKMTFKIDAATGNVFVFRIDHTPRYTER